MTSQGDIESTIGLRRGPPMWLNGKSQPTNAGYGGSIPGSGRSPGGGNCNPFQCSCLENPMDRGSWWL